MSKEKTTFEIWRDRIAHGLVAMVAPIMSAVPLLASPLGLAILIEREYYQTKIVIISNLRDAGNKTEPEFMEVMKYIDWTKDDLIDAYVGTAIGIPIGIVIVWTLVL